MRLDNDVLSFKDTYSFFNGFVSTCDWGMLIWHSLTPPSKSLLFWRLMYDKLHTDDNLTL